MTTTLGAEGGFGAQRHIRAHREVSVRTISFSLEMIGFVTVAISAWGAIIPYWGPTFGYSADGTGSWQWNLTHAMLALLPGAIGIVVGLSLLAPVRSSSAARRLSLGVGGAIAVVAGAWFAIGPIAWPVISNVPQYFVAASPLRNLANQVGYSLGPGLIFAACGAFAMGWAARNNRPLDSFRSKGLLAQGAEEDLDRVPTVSQPWPQRRATDNPAVG